MNPLERIRDKLQTKIYKAQLKAFYLHHKAYLAENQRFYAKYTINIPAFRKWMFYGRLIDMLNKTELTQNNPKTSD